ncbi:methyl-accepting chemotaxis protein [Paenibacillus arenosi]|uniref:Methyl-accepting chemotaxis protein n=1 Tax=Paenibacillus arenosi TaxID=2774142 RepID=A0ABR9AY92_9BACL|nr:methyl-accepting chemotaxis protein [Paenibacillus arenosi]MBD8498170.1 methyl-accepting chemotaxis protein [Paenibacillus arenosi]
MKQKVATIARSMQGVFQKKRMSIKQRFIILVTIITVGFMIAGTVSNLSSRTLVDSMDQMYNEHMQNVIRAEKMMLVFKQSELFLERTIESETMDEATGHVNDYMRFIMEVRQPLQEIVNSEHGEQAAKYLEAIETHLFKLEYLAAEMKGYIADGKLEQVKPEIEAEIRPIEKKVFADMLIIEESSIQAAEQIYLNNKSDATQSRILNVVMTIAVAIACIWMAVATMKVIRKPIDSLQHLMAGAAEGDLSATSTNVGTDELGRLSVSYNEMILGLRRLVELIQTSTNVLMDNVSLVAEFAVQSQQSAQQTAAAMVRTDESAKRQQSSAGETLRAMEDMANSIQHIVHATTEVADITQYAGQHAAQGVVTMEQAVTEMDRVHQSVQGAEHTLQELQQHSKAIVQVITIIQQISSQTSLLAINASIEAARAGEHGRGFSVVADEVRQLAEQSGESLKRISSMVDAIQRNTGYMANAMFEVSNQTQAGQEKVTAAGVMFRDLHQQINEVVEQTESVSASVQEMSACTEEITAASSEMAALSEHAAEEVQLVTTMTTTQLDQMSRISTILDELYEMAYGLDEQVNKFRLQQAETESKK